MGGQSEEKRSWDKVKVIYAQAVNIGARKPTGLSAREAGDMMLKAALTSAAVVGCCSKKEKSSIWE